MSDSKLFSNILGLGGNLLGGYLGQREINKGISAALGLSQPANINTPFASTSFNGGTLTNTLSPQAQGIFSGMLDASAANLASANIPAEAFASNFSEGLFKLVEGQEAEARARELDKLNAQGRFGTTGGTAQYGELLQGQALAGLTRALTSENLAFQRQSEMFNRAIDLANTAGNLSQANLALSLQGRNNAGAQLAAQGGASKGDFISSIFSSFGNAALEAAGIENPLNAAAKSIFQALGLGGAGPTIASNAGALGGSFSGGAGAATGLGEATAPLTGANAGDGFLSSLFGGGGGGLAGGTGGALTGGIAAEGAYAGLPAAYAPGTLAGAAVPFLAPLGILALSQIGAGPKFNLENAKQQINNNTTQTFAHRGGGKTGDNQPRTVSWNDPQLSHSALADALSQTSAPELWNGLSESGRQNLAKTLKRPGVPAGVFPTNIWRGSLGGGKAAQNSGLGEGIKYWQAQWSDGQTSSGRSEAFARRPGANVSGFDSSLSAAENRARGFTARGRDIGEGR